MNFLTKTVFTLITISSVLAQQTAPSSGTPNWIPLALGAILIVVGLMFLFVGKSLIRIIASIASALLLGVGAMHIMYAIQKSTDFNLILVVVVVIAAIVGGLIGMCLVKLGIMILGGFVGVSLTMLVTSTGILSPTAVWIVGAILVLGMCILAYFATDFIIIAFTSVSGGFTAMTGLDCYINTGFRNFISSLTITTPDYKVTIMLVSTIILAVIGFLVQFCFNRKRN